MTIVANVPPDKIVGALIAYGIIIGGFACFIILGLAVVGSIKRGGRGR